jgi:hypothetical protein
MRVKYTQFSVDCDRDKKWIKITPGNLHRPNQWRHRPRKFTHCANCVIVEATHELLTVECVVFDGGAGGGSNYLQLCPSCYEKHLIRALTEKRIIYRQLPE